VWTKGVSRLGVQLVPIGLAIEHYNAVLLLYGCRYRDHQGASDRGKYLDLHVLTREMQLGG
jgi:hypothetical protein